MHSSVKKKNYVAKGKTFIFWIFLKLGLSIMKMFIYKKVQKIKIEIGLERKSSFSVIFLRLEFNVWTKRG